MLVSLRIQNFALVDQLELDIAKGLTVLTGETGAGKSIILDAIDIVLGGKVNSRSIRGGSTRAIIEATFQLNESLQEWLHEREIELLDEDSLVCSREISATKSSTRTRCRVNGVVVNRRLVDQLRDRLIEITAQGQTMTLMVADRQRQLLDLYGGKPLSEQLIKVERAYAEFYSAKQALANRRQSQQERLQRIDLLEYQQKELKEAQLSEADELEQLEQERDRLSHVVELQQLSYHTYQLLYQNDTDEAAAADLLAKAERNLEEMVEYDRQLESPLEMVRSAIAQIVEAAQEINAYGDDLEADPERLMEIEARIRQLKSICSKYGPTLVEAIALYEHIQQELAELTGGEQSLEILEREERAAKVKLDEVCQELTQLRQKAATKLEKQLVKELKPLAMDKVIFECRLTTTTASATGADRVEFYFSPNAGETIQPLATIASGGEMSRFLLALKACFSQSEQHSHTLIFDEIDAGVSGKVAQAIANKLYQLSQQHQVLCVTHQPLVAAMADNHLRVEKKIVEESSTAKESNGNSNIPDIRTVVRVKALNKMSQRREELAQLTGGHSADEAIAFADSLLAKAANYRQEK